MTSKVNKVEHVSPFCGVICSFEFISCMSSREEALILSEKKRLVHVLSYDILGHYFGTLLWDDIMIFWDEN